MDDFEDNSGIKNVIIAILSILCLILIIYIMYITANNKKNSVEEVPRERQAVFKEATKEELDKFQTFKYTYKIDKGNVYFYSVEKTNE